VDKALHSGVAPDRVGFVSFTKKAVNEAKARASERFNVDQRDLTYYRTIHSLAFRQLGMFRNDVLNWTHFKEIGRELGVRMTGKRLDDVGVVSVGDQMICLENLARLSCRTYRETWEANDGDLDWFRFDQYVRTLKRYKEAMLLYDFTDMLQRYESNGVVPELDLLVVDEAQDLSQLQWRIVKRLVASAKRSYVAGDDDQAIFRWSGADVDYFLAAGFADDRQVLTHSYRLPRTVHELAEAISNRISHRHEKSFKPTRRRGAVDYVASLEDVAGLDEGNWLVLVRNNYQVRPVTDYLRLCGYAYESERDKPAENDALHAAYTFESLRAGREVSALAVRNMLQYVGQAPRSLPSGDHLMSTESVPALAGLKAAGPWYEHLTKITVEDREYFRAARRRGENLRRPRIRVSTIHGAKGGECDNVLLFTDVSNKTAREMWKKPDDETRVFYVGATRAINRLCVVEPQTPSYFAL
jgi:superfamily I DNA/RNA helicase